jgi:tetratricopeptide (TPR) repeat protein
MLTLFLFASLATAGSPECVDCCKAAGLVSCPTRIRIHGPGSHISKDAGAWRVSGLWWLDCDGGAAYDDGATVALAQRPMAGQVLRLATPESAITCFAQHCALPQSGCLRAAANTGEFVLVRCEDNQMLTEAAMRTKGQSPVVAVAPPIGLDLTLPPPATQCAAGPSLIKAANAQVNAADAKVRTGQLAAAANTYRAALTIDPCSAGGWAGLGNVALLSGDTNTAITALEAATGLKAKDPEAWVLLGRAQAASGAKQDAIRAFEKALEVSPDHPSAKTERDALLSSE